MESLPKGHHAVMCAFLVFCPANDAILCQMLRSSESAVQLVVSLMHNFLQCLRDDHTLLSQKFCASAVIMIVQMLRKFVDRKDHHCFAPQLSYCKKVIKCPTMGDALAVVWRDFNAL